MHCPLHCHHFTARCTPVALPAVVALPATPSLLHCSLQCLLHIRCTDYRRCTAIAALPLLLGYTRCSYKGVIGLHTLPQERLLTARKVDRHKGVCLLQGKLLAAMEFACCKRLLAARKLLDCMYCHCLRRRGHIAACEDEPM